MIFINFQYNLTNLFLYYFINFFLSFSKIYFLNKFICVFILLPTTINTNKGQKQYLILGHLENIFRTIKVAFWGGSRMIMKKVSLVTWGPNSCWGSPPSVHSKMNINQKFFLQSFCFCENDFYQMLFPSLFQKAHNLLKQAWDAEGSPFKGQTFDTSKLKVDPSGVLNINP